MLSVVAGSKMLGAAQKAEAAQMVEARPVQVQREEDTIRPLLYSELRVCGFWREAECEMQLLIMKRPQHHGV